MLSNPLLALIIISLYFIFIIYLGKKYTIISGILNIAILLYLPTLISTDSYIHLIKEQSSILFILLITVLTFSITNFFNLSIQLKRGHKNLFLVQTILIVFIIYICLIYSTISCFAVLYKNLSRVFNEGIISESYTTSHIDALYFSTTTFFTIGLGDIYPTGYSTLTKSLVIIEAIVSHIITVMLWPISIILLFDRYSKTD